MTNIVNSQEIIKGLQSSVEFNYNSIPEAKEQAHKALEELMFNSSFHSVEDLQEALKPLALLLDMLRQLDSQLKRVA